MPRDDMAVAFLKACDGFTAADFMWLMDGVKMRHHIYIYNPKDKTTRHPDNEVPWPALFVLSRFHKNFRLQPTKRPKMDDIKEAMVEFSNRMKWKAYFADDDDAKPFISMKYKQKKCQRYTLNPQPEINAWLNGAFETIYGKCKEILIKFSKIKELTTPRFGNIVE